VIGAEADGQEAGTWVELQHTLSDQGQPGHHAGGSRLAGRRLQRVV